MAIAAACVYNIQTDGTTTHGAGFVTGASGTDYSKTIAANLPANNTVTTGTSDGINMNTIITTQASADWVGNLITPTVGTNTTLTAGMRYEIISVVAGVSATVSTNVSGGSIFTGLAANVAFIVGGAGKFYNSGTDDTLLENSVAGNTWYIKWSATPHSCGTVAVTTTGTLTAPIKFYGYYSTQGDNPTTLSTKPYISLSGTFVHSGHWFFKYFYMYGTGLNVLSVSAAPGWKWEHLKIVNKSTTANQIAAHNAHYGEVMSCEFISYRGIALNSTVGMSWINCVAMASDTGFKITNIGCNLYRCIAIRNVTQNIDNIVSAISQPMISNCTVYGGSVANPLGIGIDFRGTTQVNGKALNNQIYGCVTGIKTPTASQVVTNEDFNNFYANTTDRTNISVGANSTALDPAFKDVQLRIGTTANTAAGNKLQDATASFITWGITPNVHYVYIQSGTGVTPGYYGILSVTSETEIVADITLTANATADKVWSIVTGFNFAVGRNAEDMAGPQTWPGACAASTGYGTIGAVQRLEDYPVVGDVRTTTIFSNGELTGTLVATSPPVKKTSDSTSKLITKTSAVA
jgi:hypothetical protein